MYGIKMIHGCGLLEIFNLYSMKLLVQKAYPLLNKKREFAIIKMFSSRLEGLFAEVL